MKTLRISKTIFPKDRPSDFNQWAQFIFGCYAFEQGKIKDKKSWDRNTYTIKQK